MTNKKFKLAAMSLATAVAVSTVGPSASAVTYYLGDGSVTVDKDDTRGAYSYQGEDGSEEHRTYVNEDEADHGVINVKGGNAPTEDVLPSTDNSDNGTEETTPTDTTTDSSGNNAENSPTAETTTGNTITVKEDVKDATIVVEGVNVTFAPSVISTSEPSAITRPPVVSLMVSEPPAELSVSSVSVSAVSVFSTPPLMVSLVFAPSLASELSLAPSPPTRMPSIVDTSTQTEVPVDAKEDKTIIKVGEGADVDLTVKDSNLTTGGNGIDIGVNLKDDDDNKETNVDLTLDNTKINLTENATAGINARDNSDVDITLKGDSILPRKPRMPQAMALPPTVTVISPLKMAQRPKSKLLLKTRMREPGAFIMSVAGPAI